MEAKENKNPEEETPKKSNRELFMERYKTDYPDDVEGDEEVMYGRLNERNADYDRLRENDSNFRKLVNEHPEYGGMVSDMMDGKNFIESFLGRNAKEDVMAAYDDPEMAQKLAEAQAKFMKDQADRKQLQEEGKANVKESINRLNAYCEANGIDPEGADKLWGACIDFGSNVLKGIFTEELFDVVSKGMTHDADVEAARAEGEIAGHNAKVQTQMAKGKGPEGIPPTFDGGQGGAGSEPQPKGDKKRFYNPFSHEWEEK